MYFKVPAIREDVFIWLNDLESRQQSNHQSEDSGSRESINRLILNYIPKLVDMDSSQAIKLVEQWLRLDDNEEDHSEFDHLKIVDERLWENSELTYKYLSTYLNEKESSI